MENLKNLEEYKSLQNNNDTITVLFFMKPDSEKCSQVEKILTEVEKENRDKANFFRINVSENKEIHKELGVTSIPTVVSLKNGNIAKMVLGVQPKSLYNSLLTASVPQQSDDGKKAKKVTVYTTPTCPHCTTVKNFLTTHNIIFREVNVAADTSAAEELMRRSGQTGVPQTDIDGKLVVGADMKKISELLDINLKN